MSKTRKWIACLAAALLIFQTVPALMEEGEFNGEYISNVTVGSLEGFREALEIISEGGAYMLEGDELTLTANEDYMPLWSSSNPDVVEIAEGYTPTHTATIQAFAPGEAEITAAEGSQSKTIRVTVVDPETYEGDAEKKPAEGEEQGEAQEVELDAEGNPIQKDKMVIVINGGTQTSPYTGEEQTFGEYEATSTNKAFDPEKVRTTREIAVAATECGYYMMELKEADFAYDDPSVKALFVINDGYLKIAPAVVTVTPDDLTKTAGEEDPELTASVTGLLNEEETIEYTLIRDEGEHAGTYEIRAEGEEIQGHYRVQFLPGTFTILTAEGNPRRVTITSSLAAGEPAYAGMEVTLTAHLEGFEGVNYTLQWQFSLDKENWEDMPGATGETYTYELSVETAAYNWRVVATEIAAGEAAAAETAE